MAMIPPTVLLGFEPAMSAIGLMMAVEQGLPIAALERVARSISPTDTNEFLFRMVPKATLSRRRASARLSPEEGARVARLASVWTIAVDVWKSEEAARDFLFRPHALLDGRWPVDVVVATELGRPLVEGILGQLKHGTAA